MACSPFTQPLTPPGKGSRIRSRILYIKTLSIITTEFAGYYYYYYYYYSHCIYYNIIILYALSRQPELLLTIQTPPLFRPTKLASRGRAAAKLCRIAFVRARVYIKYTIIIIIMMMIIIFQRVNITTLPVTRVNVYIYKYSYYIICGSAERVADVEGTLAQSGLRYKHT